MLFVPGSRQMYEYIGWVKRKTDHKEWQQRARGVDRGITWLTARHKKPPPLMHDVQLIAENRWLSGTANLPGNYSEPTLRLHLNYCSTTVLCNINTVQCRIRSCSVSVWL